MRALLVLAIVGCSDPYGSSQYCVMDSDCGGDVCGRDQFCHAASELRGVKVTWTVNGGQANETTCAPSPDLYLEFDSDYPGNAFGYAPVPCMQGQFFIDKIPTFYNQVQISVDGGHGYGLAQPIDSSNTASFNLSL